MTRPSIPEDWSVVRKSPEPSASLASPASLASLTGRGAPVDYANISAAFLANYTDRFDALSSGDIDALLDRTGASRHYALAAYAVETNGGTAPTTAEHIAANAPTAPPAPLAESGAQVLNDVRDWLARFICVNQDSDLDLLALWAVHTHLTDVTYTTPRLLLDSPMPGSGKTTVLEHLGRLAYAPVQMASVTSAALLVRMLEHDSRTFLIDEADRTLSAKNDLTPDLLAIINSGYKKGASRPVLEPVKGGGWEASEMSTYAPIAMAGNNPHLPDDTKQRCIRVLLLPDLQGTVEDSDWEYIEEEADALGARIAAWAVGASQLMRDRKHLLPPGIKGRNKEKWRPLARVAAAAGGDWPAIVHQLALNNLEEQAQEMRDGNTYERPAVTTMRHLHGLWPEGATHWSSTDAVHVLANAHPDVWGLVSPTGRVLTTAGLGRMLSSSFKLATVQVTRGEPRSYARAQLAPLWAKLGISTPAPLPVSDASDATDASDAGATP